MSIQTLAAILLIGRLTSVVFILMVLKRQLALFHHPIDDHIRNFRVMLFALACVIFLGNMVPILIDTLTVFSDVTRNNPSSIGIAYAFSNNITSLVASIFIWLLYRMAADIGSREKEG